LALPAIGRAAGIGVLKIIPRSVVAMIQPI
jgi:hypothetical protein